MGATGAALVAREAHAFRAFVGVPATAAARGAFALRVLRARAAAEGGDGARPRHSGDTTRPRLAPHCADRPGSPCSRRP
eukprot:638849-Pleurochrysis_carterae.AAC.1